MKGKYVIFSIDAELFAIDILGVSCIEEVGDILMIPNAPGYLKGVVKKRGEVIPVLDLHYIFGKEEKNIKPSKILVIEIGVDKMALLVDEVEKIFQTDTVDELPELAKGPKTEYAKGVIDREGKLVLLLAPEKIISGAQKGLIDKVLEGVQ